MCKHIEWLMVESQFEKNRKSLNGNHRSGLAYIDRLLIIIELIEIPSILEEMIRSCLFHQFFTFSYSIGCAWKTFTCTLIMKWLHYERKMNEHQFTVWIECLWDVFFHKMNSCFCFNSIESFQQMHFIANRCARSLKTQVKISPTFCSTAYDVDVLLTYFNFYNLITRIWINPTIQ